MSTPSTPPPRPTPLQTPASAAAEPPSAAPPDEARFGEWMQRMSARSASRWARRSCSSVRSSASIAPSPRDCDSPTEEARAERWRCVVADYCEIRDVSAGRLADPYRCATCNLSGAHVRADAGLFGVRASSNPNTSNCPCLKSIDGSLSNPNRSYMLHAVAIARVVCRTTRDLPEARARSMQYCVNALPIHDSCILA